MRNCALSLNRGGQNESIMSSEHLSILRSLQHGDSFFPAGAIAMSGGLETLVDERRIDSAYASVARVDQVEVAGGVQEQTRRIADRGVGGGTAVPRKARCAVTDYRFDPAIRRDAPDALVAEV